MISLGIMTQHSKASYLELLFSCLLSQEGISREMIEICIFGDPLFPLTLLQPLQEKYPVFFHRYSHPFNIGYVRNQISQIASNEYVVYLDDDVLCCRTFLREVLQLIKEEKPDILAGLSFHVFKKPQELKSILEMLNWTEVVERYGRRDSYLRKVGRYRENLRDAPWLGVIGRNMVIRRELIQKDPFFECDTMGFEDTEFAFRTWKKGGKLLLKNDLLLTVLHAYHSQPLDKKTAYRKTFDQLVEKKRLPSFIKSLFFPEQKKLMKLLIIIFMILRKINLSRPFSMIFLMKSVQEFIDVGNSFFAKK